MGRTSLTNIPEESHERDFVTEKKRYEDVKAAAAAAAAAAKKKW